MTVQAKTIDGGGSTVVGIGKGDWVVIKKMARIDRRGNKEHDKVGVVRYRGAGNKEEGAGGRRKWSGRMLDCTLKLTHERSFLSFIL